ncbi:hypothetical protein GOB94_06175 [Granulicella sp. 5B5]|uniref:BrnT family toxin n=1 Tax=Granulicella sp. 5B5 TaxID=1617967 RepID=UPI0015F36546|nr:BrnT family toxin [Granulicella sp. 5B5]QMV18319.1 hypothetical protein GOB94_06175 [Granulicella sp. 5B5]
MDVYYLYRGETFVWDGLKAAKNRAKHGVRFETACEVFFDRAFVLEDASVDGETRVAVIGNTTESRLLYVVHVEREDLYLRLISAREATKREEKIYYEDSR